VGDDFILNIPRALDTCNEHSDSVVFFECAERVVMEQALRLMSMEDYVTASSGVVAHPAILSILQHQSAQLQHQSAQLQEQGARLDRLEAKYKSQYL
jgi:hypothetical protein